ncbi:hypothetical protein T484DRAFT_1798855, partial [Baffinella frigidus]
MLASLIGCKTYCKTYCKTVQLNALGTINDVVQILLLWHMLASLTTDGSVLVNRSALSTIIYVVLILLLWHMLASLIGMQLFRCPVSPPNACKARTGSGECPKFCPIGLEAARGARTASGECPKFCPIGLERREGEAVDICYLSDEFMFEHCPWTPHRNFNTFRDGMITLFF